MSASRRVRVQISPAFMHKIHLIADQNQLRMAGLDVTVVSLGDFVRPQALPPGQWVIGVGALGGSMWQLISKPFANREDAESALYSGFEPLDTEVAIRWARSLLAAKVAFLIDAEIREPVTVMVSGKSRHADKLAQAHAKAEAWFGRLKVGNPPADSQALSFEISQVEAVRAADYRTWFEEACGSGRWSPQCEIVPLPKSAVRRAAGQPSPA